MPERKQYGRYIAGLYQVVGCPAVNHVLPDQHSQSVAVIIPPHRLYLTVLAYHVKALFLCRLDVENHRLVTHRRQKAFGIVALVKDSFLEIGLVVEAKPWDSAAVRLCGEDAHAKIALHHILSIYNADII